MTDLAVLVPSRGRPANVARLVQACEKTCRAATHLLFGFDDDDPLLKPDLAAAEDWECTSIQAPRQGLTAWTNALAAIGIKTFAAPWLASLGDDMVPLTDGWDERLITAAEHAGGMAYPDDHRRADIPEAIVMNSRFVTALGWMALPALDHWFIDDVWGALGRGAGCLAYVPDVVVEHRHPNVTGQPGDATYDEAGRSFRADQAAYRSWRLRQMPRDIATVRTCSNQP